MELNVYGLDNEKALQAFEKVLENARSMGLLNGDEALSVSLMNPEQVHELNRIYRHVDRTTDVLSFPAELELDDQRDLGDIFINENAVREQAKEYGHSELRELCFLFCHGLLHLLGYDHMEKDEELEMRSLQRELLKNVAARPL